MNQRWPEGTLAGARAAAEGRGVSLTAWTLEAVEVALAGGVSTHPAGVVGRRVVPDLDRVRRVAPKVDALAARQALLNKAKGM